MLYKEEKSTLEALKIIQRVLGISSRDIGVAGLKDAFAKTYQLVAVNTRRIDTLPGIIKKDKIKLILVGFVNKPLRRGDLWGNKFTITLIINKEEYTKFLHNYNALLQEKALPAYYGYQRFGTRRPITHLIGKHLLKRDWCLVLRAIIDLPFITENDYVVTWRLNALNIKNTVKSTIGLNPEDSIYNALMERRESACYNIIAKRIPKKLLEIFLSAYQSYLFNVILSLRIEDNSYYTTDISEKIRVPGYRLNKCNEYCRYVMEYENITSKEFNIRELGIKAPSYNRPVKMIVYEPQIRIAKYEGRKDLLKIIISFKLTRGMYATIVLRELTRANPLKFT